MVFSFPLSRDLPNVSTHLLQHVASNAGSTIQHRTLVADCTGQTCYGKQLKSNLHYTVLWLLHYRLLTPKITVFTPNDLQYCTPVQFLFPIYLSKHTTLFSSAQVSSVLTLLLCSVLVTFCHCSITLTK